jgi:hypothetical protein
LTCIVVDFDLVPRLSLASLKELLAKVILYFCTSDIVHLACASSFLLPFTPQTQVKGLVAARKNGGTGGTFSFLLALAAEEQHGGEGAAPSSAGASEQSQWGGLRSVRNRTPPYVPSLRGKSSVGLRSGEEGSSQRSGKVEASGITMEPDSVAEGEEEDEEAEQLPKMFPLGNVHLLRRCGRKVERGRATSHVYHNGLDVLKGFVTRLCCYFGWYMRLLLSHTMQWC